MERTIPFQYKAGRNVPQVRWPEAQEMPYLAFPLLEETGLVAHAFSTRLGGVSAGKFASTNFSVTRGDEPEHVAENFRRMAGALKRAESRLEAQMRKYPPDARKRALRRPQPARMGCLRRARL